MGLRVCPQRELRIGGAGLFREGSPPSGETLRRVLLSGISARSQLSRVPGAKSRIGGDQRATWPDSPVAIQRSQHRFSLTAPETLRSRITDITRARQPRGFAAWHDPVRLNYASAPAAPRGRGADPLLYIREGRFSSPDSRDEDEMFKSRPHRYHGEQLLAEHKHASGVITETTTPQPRTCFGPEFGPETGCVRRLVSVTL